MLRPINVIHGHEPCNGNPSTAARRAFFPAEESAGFSLAIVIHKRATSTCNRTFPLRPHTGTYLPNPAPVKICQGLVVRVAAAVPFFDLCKLLTLALALEEFCFRGRGE